MVQPAVCQDCMAKSTSRLMGQKGGPSSHDLNEAKPNGCKRLRRTQEVALQQITAGGRNTRVDESRSAVHCER
ncbi:unnamed protein product [Protopolystoma xenopodis]|uniref:Uncharacterized protein n=1 Tax=Protopolystoma xenopodis TaxID=117903 RepID=A0A3S5CR06_9PLAT|nr:unnamed protein product [Protopolystoma xenopodis]